MKRFKTRPVMVGRVEIGGNNPIRIQSMTNTDTADHLRTAEQIMRLEDCGCEIARVTVQGVKEAQACEKIKNNLLSKGYGIPLVADIHFFPKAAIVVADFVDKVRINPGNFVKLIPSELTPSELTQSELTHSDLSSKIESELYPLLDKLKKQKKALRIGVNHGSLSEKIMHRYGNTSEGMVESALEYGAICRKFGFDELIFSMKASNPLIMIEAYRLLVEKMMERCWDYPLHLGVTEAGDEEDGIIKSSFGIGALLLDGIGDTIRVSLTADPEKEIPPAKKIASLIGKYCSRDNSDYSSIISTNENSLSTSSNNKKGITKGTGLLGPLLSFLRVNKQNSHNLKNEKGSKIFKNRWLAILEKSNEKDDLNIELDLSHVDGFFVEEKGKRYIYAQNELNKDLSIPLLNLDELEAYDQSKPFGIFLKNLEEKNLVKLKSVRPEVIFFSPEKDQLTVARYLKDWLLKQGIEAFLISHFSDFGPKEDLTISSSAILGSLLADDIIDGICISGDLSLEEKYFLTFSLLQASRKKTVKTEFISCPGCGRTLYDIQSVTKKIKAKTSHLPGVKIAIMGCIVNGPGEMSDADFGFIGSGKNKIDLYVGKRCVEKNIDFSLAEDKLIEIIKKEGRWLEKISNLAEESLSLKNKKLTCEQAPF